MHNANAAYAYKSNQNLSVMTADPMKLVIMIYEGGITNLKASRNAILTKNIEKRNKFIYKSQDFIEELIHGLNFELGGEISKNLYSLYEYFIWSLNMAIVKNSVEYVNNVIKNMEGLLLSWKQIYRENGRKN